MNNISRTFDGYKLVNKETGEEKYTPDAEAAIKLAVNGNTSINRIKFKAVMNIADFVEFANITEIKED